MKILPPLLFARSGNRLRWNVLTPAGRGLRYAGEMSWGQFSSNRGGRNVRYWLRCFHFAYWRKREQRAKAMGA